MRLRRLVLLIFGMVAFMAAPAAADAQSLDWPLSRPPLALPARPIAFPPYQLKTLDNGLQVLVIPQHEEPSVSFRLIVRAGAAEDPAERPGVADVVASLLDQGTTSRSAEAIANMVESAGGMLSVGAGEELSYISVGVVRDRFDQLMDLVSEIVQHPAFAPAEISRQLQNATSGMQVSYDDPEYIAGAVFNRVVYGTHPYGRPGSGTPESLPHVTRDALVAFHKTWFVPNNALLAIVGDLSADDAFAAANRAFGGWAKHGVPTVDAATPPPPSRRVVVIDKPGAVQTEIRVGQVTLARTSPDYLTLDLAMRVLGGEGANRLFGVLRTDRALTYGASAELQTFKQAGAFVAQTNTRSAETGQALRLMVDEVAKLARDRIDIAELHGVQDYVSGSFPLSIETPSAIALQVLNQLFYGLDLKDLETHRERVNNVTTSDILRVAAEYLLPDRLTIVLVGDASQFIDQLQAMGFPEYERIPLSQLDLLAPDLKKKG
jgi:zinc protease